MVKENAAGTASSLNREPRKSFEYNLPWNFSGHLIDFPSLARWSPYYSSRMEKIASSMRGNFTFLKWIDKMLSLKITSLTCATSERDLQKILYIQRIRQLHSWTVEKFERRLKNVLREIKIFLARLLEIAQPSFCFLLPRSFPSTRFYRHLRALKNFHIERIVRSTEWNDGRGPMTSGVPCGSFIVVTVQVSTQLVAQMCARLRQTSQ